MSRLLQSSCRLVQRQCRVFSTSSTSSSKPADTPLHSFVDLKSLTQLTPDQLAPIRGLIDDNMALREQVRSLQALTRAQSVILSKSKLDSTEQTGTTSGTTASATPDYQNADYVTRKALEQQKYKNFLLMALATGLLLQGVVSFKNEQIVRRELDEKNQVFEDNNKLLETAMKYIERLVSISGDQHKKEAVAIEADIKERLRLYRLKEATKQAKAE